MAQLKGRSSGGPASRCSSGKEVVGEEAFHGTAVGVHEQELIEVATKSRTTATKPHSHRFKKSKYKVLPQQPATPHSLSLSREYHTCLDRRTVLPLSLEREGTSNIKHLSFSTR